MWISTSLRYCTNPQLLLARYDRQFRHTSLGLNCNGSEAAALVDTLSSHQVSGVGSTVQLQ